MEDPSPAAGDWLALYGTLMRGLGPAEALGVAPSLRYVGPCVIPGELFDLGEYPGLRPGTGEVVAELHVVLDPEVFVPLDAFEGYDAASLRESLYLRERLELVRPADTVVWTYVYNRVPDAGARLPDGDWRAECERRACAASGGDEASRQPGTPPAAPARRSP